MLFAEYGQDELMPVNKIKLRAAPKMVNFYTYTFFARCFGFAEQEDDVFILGIQGAVFHSTCFVLLYQSTSKLV